MMESSTPASESGAPTRKIVGTAPQSGAASRISPRRSAITIPMRQPPPRTSTDAVAAPATPNPGEGTEARDEQRVQSDRQQHRGGEDQEPRARVPRGAEP